MTVSKLFISCATPRVVSLGDEGSLGKTFTRSQAGVNFSADDLAGLLDSICHIDIGYPGQIRRDFDSAPIQKNHASAPAAEISKKISQFEDDILPRTRERPLMCFGRKIRIIGGHKNKRNIG